MNSVSAIPLKPSRRISLQVTVYRTQCVDLHITIVFLVSSTSLLNLEFCLYYTQCICVHFMGFFSIYAPFMKYFLFVECVSFHSFKNLLVIKKEQLIYMCISQLFVWMFSIYKVTQVFLLYVCLK